MKSLWFFACACVHSIGSLLRKHRLSCCLQTLQAALTQAPNVQLEVTKDALCTHMIESERHHRSEALSCGLRKLKGLVAVEARESPEAADLALAVLADAVAHGWQGPARLDLAKSKIGRGDHRMAITACIVLSSAHITTIDIYDSGLGPDGTTQLAQALGASASVACLQHLELGCNAIGHRGSLALAPVLANMTALRHLGLNNNDIMHTCATLMAALQPCTLLRALHLGRNRIEDADLAETVQALSAFPYLTSLDLGLNRCAHGGARALARAGVGSFRQLRELDLSFNCLGSHNTSAANAAAELGPLIHVCSGTLEKLTLSHNSLSARDIMAVFDPTFYQQGSLHTHTHTHARTHARARAHTHTQLERTWHDGCLQPPRATH